MRAEALVVAVGFAAGLLDYSLAVGFGLVASLLLAGPLGWDPRDAAGTAAAAQLIAALPAVLAHKRSGNVPAGVGRRGGALAAFSLSSLAAALPSSLAVARLGPEEAAALYSLSLLTLALLLVTEGGAGGRRHPALAAAYGLAAGFYKAAVGGGYGAVAMAARGALGLDPKGAVALTPLLKLPTFAAVAGTYAAAGMVGAHQVAALTLGLLLSVPAAPRVLRRLSGGTVRAALAIALVAVALLKLRSALAG